MKTPDVPVDEAERLAELARYRILDTEPEASLDDLTKLAAQIFRVPIALISLVDAERQWFKSRQGLEATQTPRSVSFCGHVVASAHTMVVSDACRDERFSDNPLVTGPPHVRFYAGAPLRTPSGRTLGTLCLIDHNERTFSAGEQETLEALARQTADQLELRRLNQELNEHESATRMANEALQSQTAILQAVVSAHLRFVGSQPASTIDQLLEDVRRVTGSEHGFIGEIIQSPLDAPDLTSHAISPGRFGGSSLGFFAGYAAKGIEFNTLQDLCFDAIVKGEPVIFDPSEIVSKLGQTTAEQLGLHSFLCVPLHSNGKLVAVFAVANRPGGYQPKLLEHIHPFSLAVARIMELARAERERIKAEQELKQTVERQHLVADATMDAYYDWDMVTHEVWRNEGYRRLFGSPKKIEPNATWWEDRIHPDDRQRVIKSIRAAFEARTPFWKEEYHLRLANDAYASVLDRGFIAYSPEGKPVRFVGSILDWTEREQAELQLVQQADTMRQLAQSVLEAEQRVRDEVVSVLHDDVQQLLAAARLKADLLSTNSGPSKGLAKQVRDLIAQCITATRTLSTQLSPQVIETGDAAATMIWLAEWMKSHHGLSVHFETGSIPRLSRATNEVLFRTTRELLFNVVKHAGVPAAKIELTAATPGRVVLTVSDQGRGFSEESITHGQNTGLRQLRQRLSLIDGTLTLSSHSETGTSVVVALPISPQSAVRLSDAR